LTEREEPIKTSRMRKKKRIASDRERSRQKILLPVLKRGLKRIEGTWSGPKGGASGPGPSSHANRGARRKRGQRKGEKNSTNPPLKRNSNIRSLLSPPQSAKGWNEREGMLRRGVPRKRRHCGRVGGPLDAEDKTRPKKGNRKENRQPRRPH